jgi:hypothetical protein
VRLRRRDEVRIDPHMQLLRTRGEPAAAPSQERLGLDELDEPEQLSVETPRLLLASGGRCHLNMVDAENEHA